MINRYFDNAATSFPKAPDVGTAMADYLTRIGCNVGRGNYGPAHEAEAAVLELRVLLCRLFGGSDPRNVILTPGATHSLNYVLQGLARPGDRIVTSSIEHNAVMRPLSRLKRHGVLIQRLACDQTGTLLNPDWAFAALDSSVRLAVFSHASNVSGTIQPIEQLGALCHKNNIFFCVDAAQTAGILPIDMQALHIDALAFPGHKGLMGPQGIGGLLLSDRLAAELEPLILGGTGSASESLDPPDFLPDRFEAGTLNLPGAFGLLQAVRWLLSRDPARIRARESALTTLFIDRLHALDPAKVRVFGSAFPDQRVGVISVDFPGRDNADIAFCLEQEYGILTRCGLHCAPMAHRTLGTFPTGTVRFSIGAFTTEEDILAAVDAVDAVLRT